MVSGRISDRRALAGILVVGFLVRGLTAAFTPAWNAPDEYPHYWVAAQLAESGTMPTGGGAFPGYEAYQPPLHYLLLASVMKGLSLSEMEYSEQLLRPTVDLIALRFVSVILGISVIACGWVAARHIFPADLELAVVTASFIAVLPSFVVVTSSITNDALVSFLGAISCAIFVRSEVIRPKTSLIGGLAVGAAIASKLTGLIVVPVQILWTLQRARLRSPKSSTVYVAGALGFALGAVVAVGRNIAQYGTPVVLPSGMGAEINLTIAHFAWALRNLAWSFWLAAGRTYHVQLPAILYALTVGPLTGLALAGWWRRRREIGLLHLFVKLTFVIGVAVLMSLYFTVSYPAGLQTSWGKNLYPLLPLIVVFLAAGWRGLGRRTWRWISAGTLVLLFAGCLWQVLQLQP